MIQSQHSLPLAPHLMAAPSNFGNFSREEVEKDSRHGPMLISRNPSLYSDVVEKDMKRNAPIVSSSLHPAPPTSVGSSPKGVNLSIQSSGCPRNPPSSLTSSTVTPGVEPGGVVDTHQHSGDLHARKLEPDLYNAPQRYDSALDQPGSFSDLGKEQSESVRHRQGVSSTQGSGSRVQLSGLASHVMVAGCPNNSSNTQPYSLSSQPNIHMTSHPFSAGSLSKDHDTLIYSSHSSLNEFPPNHQTYSHPSTQSLHQPIFYPPSYNQPSLHHQLPSYLHSHSLNSHPQSRPYPKSLQPSTYRPSCPPSHPYSLDQQHYMSMHVQDYNQGSLPLPQSGFSRQQLAPPKGPCSLSYVSTLRSDYSPPTGQEHHYLGSGKSQDPLLGSIDDHYNSLYRELGHHQPHYHQVPEWQYQCQGQPCHQMAGESTSHSTSFRSYQHPSVSQTLKDEQLLVEELQKNLSLSDDTQAAQGEGESRVMDPNSTLSETDLGSIDIVEQPKDISVELHGRAVFTCRARLLNSAVEGEGAGPCLQWYKGDIALVGELKANLVLEDVLVKDVGFYHCVVTHPNNSEVKKHSRVAELTIGINSRDADEETKPKAPVIVEQPSDHITVQVGSDLVLPLKVKGEEPISFKWYKDTRVLEYCNKASLVIPTAVCADSGQYCCSISNIRGSQLSRSFYVEVLITSKREDSASVKGQRQRPTSLHNWEGSNISDVFLREVGYAITPQISNWQKLTTYLGLSHSDLTDIRAHSTLPEEQTFRLLYRWREKYRENKTLLKIRLQRAGINFESLISNIPAGQTKGVEHLLIAKPCITVHPQSCLVIYGQAFSLSIKVKDSSHTCAFQWYKNHTLLNGKTSPHLTIRSAVDSDAGEYYCVAANRGGATDSDIAFIKVINPHTLPSIPVPWHGARVGEDDMEKNYAYHQLQGTDIRGGNSGVNVSKRTAVTTLGQISVDDLTMRHDIFEDTQPRGQDEVGGAMIPASGGDLSGKFIARRGSGNSGIIMDSKKKLTILQHPQSQVIEVGDPLTLTCRAVGDDLKYLWYFNGLSLQREDRNEYFINCFTDEDEGVYFCKVSNSWGELNSDMAHVVMKDD